MMHANKCSHRILITETLVLPELWLRTVSIHNMSTTGQQHSLLLKLVSFLCMVLGSDIISLTNIFILFLRFLSLVTLSWRKFQYLSTWIIFSHWCPLWLRVIPSNWKAWALVRRLRLLCTVQFSSTVFVWNRDVTKLSKISPCFGY